MGPTKRGRPPGSGFSAITKARVRYLYETEGYGPRAIERILMREDGERPSWQTIKKMVVDLTRGAKAGEDDWDFLEATPEERRLMAEYVAHERLGDSVPTELDTGVSVDPPGADGAWPSATVAKWYVALRQLEPGIGASFTARLAQAAAHDPAVGRSAAMELMHFTHSLGSGRAVPYPTAHSGETERQPSRVGAREDDDD